MAHEQQSYSTYALNDTGYHNSALAYENLVNDVYFNAGFVDPHAFNYEFSNEEIEVLMNENLLDTLNSFIDSYADIVTTTSHSNSQQDIGTNERARSLPCHCDSPQCGNGM